MPASVGRCMQWHYVDDLHQNHGIYIWNLVSVRSTGGDIGYPIHVYFRFMSAILFPVGIKSSTVHR